MKFPLSQSALSWCKGKGLEIGASAHNPFGLDTLNVDLSDETSTFKQEELEICGEMVRVDIVASGDDLPVDDASQDFVISSHVLEHFTNPVKALLEWDRVVKPGGIIFMIVPHKERTFDSGRERTTLQHLIDDWLSGDTVGCGQPMGHHHVWITEDVVELLTWMKGEFSLDWGVVEVDDVDDKVGNGFTIVIQKGGT